MLRKAVSNLFLLMSCHKIDWHSYENIKVERDKLCLLFSGKESLLLAALQVETQDAPSSWYDNVVKQAYGHFYLPFCFFSA